VMTMGSLGITGKHTVRAFFCPQAILRATSFRKVGPFTWRTAWTSQRVAGLFGLTTEPVHAVRGVWVLPIPFNLSTETWRGIESPWTPWTARRSATVLAQQPSPSQLRLHESQSFGLDCSSSCHRRARGEHPKPKRDPRPRQVLVLGVSNRHQLALPWEPCFSAVPHWNQPVFKAPERDTRLRRARHPIPHRRPLIPPTIHK